MCIDKAIAHDEARGFKSGDLVRIKDKEWFEENCQYFFSTYSYVYTLTHLCGTKFRVTDITEGIANVYVSGFGSESVVSLTIDDIEHVIEDDDFESDPTVDFLGEFLAKK